MVNNAKRLRELMDLAETMHKLGSLESYLTPEALANKKHVKADHRMKFKARKPQPYDHVLMTTPFSI